MNFRVENCKIWILGSLKMYACQEEKGSCGERLQVAWFSRKHSMRVIRAPNFDMGVVVKN